MRRCWEIWSSCGVNFALPGLTCRCARYSTELDDSSQTQDRDACPPGRTGSGPAGFDVADNPKKTDDRLLEKARRQKARPEDGEEAGPKIEPPDCFQTCRTAEAFGQRHR